MRYASAALDDRRGASSFKRKVKDNRPQPNELKRVVHGAPLTVPSGSPVAVETKPMPHALLAALFGCFHGKTTFPLTPGSPIGSASRGPALNGPYVVCLDCGKEFRYNWSEMRIAEPLKAARQPVVCDRAAGV